MANYAYPGKTISGPKAAHIHRLQYIRTYNEDGTPDQLQWTAEIRVKDVDGNPSSVWDESQYRVSGEGPGLVTVPEIITAAETYLVSKGFTPEA